MDGRGLCRQRGVVLVIALVFLMLLSLLAISAASRSLLQERMAGGLRDAQLADMGAEAALRGAEWRLWKASATSAGLRCGSTVLTDCYQFDLSGLQSPAVSRFRTGVGWNSSNGTEYNSANGGANFVKPGAGFDNAALAHNPRYLIEDLGAELPPDTGAQHESGATGSTGTGYTSITRHIYRITARSTGGSETTVRVLESTFSAKGD
ncbi:pilus assembly PilX family protein [Dyella solisilvae]|nr:PilX N-terminal domain-containing pilus assembly protein [Dyella solisilvae]